MLTYFIEVDVVAIWIAAVLFRQNNKQTSRRETSNIIFQWLLAVFIFMCLSDISALVFEGKTFSGAGIIIGISNAVYFITQSVVLYLWMLFFMVRLKHLKTLKSRFTIITAIPILLFLILFISNPYSNMFYYIDANNVYHRGNLVFLHWIEEAIYIIWTFLLICQQVITTKDKHAKKGYISYFTFYIPLTVGYISQMLFYGVSASQIGLILSLLMVHLSVQDKQIIRDDLTGLNNRRALYNHELALIGHDDVNITLFMIDVDKFKYINDTFGHLKGDEALKQVATILRTALGSMPGSRLIIYRYAGDEFVIVGTNINIHTIETAKANIQAQVDYVNSLNLFPFKLSVSVGVATSTCMNTEEFDLLLNKADENMYNNKMSKRKQSKISEPISNKIDKSSKK